MVERSWRNWRDGESSGYEIMKKGEMKGSEIRNDFQGEYTSERGIVILKDRNRYE